MPDNSGMPASEPVAIPDLVAYGEGAIVSRTLLDLPTGTVTLFAFDAGQTISEHTTPFDALVQVMAGSIRFTIGGVDMTAVAGQSVLMPANIPHALTAESQAKMLLTMIRS